MRRRVAWVLALAAGVFSVTRGDRHTLSKDAEKDWMMHHQGSLEQYGMTSDKHLYGKIKIVPQPGRTRAVRVEQTIDQASAPDSLELQTLGSAAVSHQESNLFHVPYLKSPERRPSEQNEGVMFPKHLFESTPLYDEHYTKYLESLGNEQFSKYPPNNLERFKPANHKYTNSEILNTYNNIQEILNSRDYTTGKPARTNKHNNQNSKYIKYKSPEKVFRRKPHGKLVYNHEPFRAGNRCSYGPCRRLVRGAGGRPTINSVRNSFDSPIY